jgi:hypothetical protein
MKLTVFTVVLPGEKWLTLRVPYALEHMSHEGLLEEIFAWFNHGSGRECDVFLGNKMRSLSVNDFVRIDDMWWQCKSVGWARCAAAYVDEICAAVNRHPKLAKNGAWSVLNTVMYERKAS